MTLRCNHTQTLSQNYWNPFRDWNIGSTRLHQPRELGLKTTETLLGIETQYDMILLYDKTFVSKLLKPF